MNCPHCSKDIPNALTKEAAEEAISSRVNAKNATIKEQEAELAKARAALKEREGDAKRIAELEGVVAATKETALFAEHGVKDPAAIRRIKALHSVDVDDAKAEGKEAPDLSTWLAGPAKESPAVQAYLGKPAQGSQTTAAAPPPAPAAAPAPPRPPAPNAGVVASAAMPRATSAADHLAARSTFIGSLPPNAKNRAELLAKWDADNPRPVAA